MYRYASTIFRETFAQIITTSYWGFLRIMLLCLSEKYLESSKTVNLKSQASMVTSVFRLIISVRGYPESYLDFQSSV